jgi:hypothetical protein
LAQNFHFGLEINRLDNVHSLYKEFLAGGVRMEAEVFNNSRGSRFFYHSPGGVLTEINIRADTQKQE